ncbi:MULTISPECIES: RsmB/NOP family class I SAM-dependent RNA methyltransferase [unclassified Carboxydocella]|uniref:RsmB/NOP family class I SAM-dependent RNA methyltransferase n=1 Tax=unclassified Carboxydocella TaxID=2685367 RepID=UPI0009D46ABD|nr:MULTISPECIES: RsmB/NOP family class I SAM-dependent RNA methyltransferase [unclassified Carboxydocella]GAW29035.1 SAM-dependent methyltransferase [Carboxydocella sp. ULO1]GAW30872.1 SAM-dependent methyltransferase [Carboxydocella sp. JDF658]
MAITAERLPREFVQRLEPLLGEEWPEFLAALAGESQHGLRQNPLKIQQAEWEKIAPFPLERVPWCREGYYLQEEERPGKHPYYHAGLYYIQEPSAMAPVEALEVQPGEKVLDLCAAPGGKTTQIGAKLQGKGILVANDNNPQRIRPMVKYVETFGLTNCLIFNERPERLARHFPGYFDKILVDAPCSGEGMFRREPESMGAYQKFGPERCRQMQREILRAAARMLKPGGVMVYSTCTFNPYENEGTIQEFLQEHSEFQLEPVPQAHLYSPGRPDWVVGGRPELALACRIWPHKNRGEGHFLARLRKNNNGSRLAGAGRPGGTDPYLAEGARELASWHRFRQNYLKTELNGRYWLNGGTLYLVPPELPVLQGLKLIRPGLTLGNLYKGKFYPDYALAMALKPEQFAQPVYFTLDAPELRKYLKGETLPAGAAKGWHLLCLDRWPLGWALAVDGYLKNYYPKGWRLQS